MPARGETFLEAFLVNQVGICLEKLLGDALHPRRLQLLPMFVVFFGKFKSFDRCNPEVVCQVSSRSITVAIPATPIGPFVRKAQQLAVYINLAHAFLYAEKVKEVSYL